MSTGLERMGLLLQGLMLDDRTAIITEPVRSEQDLPDILPGHEYECVIETQKFVVLRRILVRDLVLVRLEIGNVKDVPFELESKDRAQRNYRLKGLDGEALKKDLVMAGAAVATRDTIAIAPELEVRLLLRNENGVPAKPRAALFVQEEKSTW
jgi:hypothetical protein